MATPKIQTATWNREDRDLLVTLRTNQENTNNRLASMEVLIKDINMGISARLLNLEGNAVSRIEVEKFEERIANLEAASNQWLGKQSLIGASLGLLAGLVGSLISAGYIHH